MRVGYSLPPQFDANGLPGARPAPGNLVAGLEDLAEQMAASGVTSVPGDVLIDTRPFEDWTPTESTISPIVVNDNLLGVITTPGAVGESPTFETVPETAAFDLVNDVETGGVASTTANAITEWINWIGEQPYGADFPELLLILGEDGSIGMLGTDSPRRGTSRPRPERLRRSTPATADC